MRWPRSVMKPTCGYRLRWSLYRLSKPSATANLLRCPKCAVLAFARRISTAAPFRTPCIRRRRRSCSKPERSALFLAANEQKRLQVQPTNHKQEKDPHNRGGLSLGAVVLNGFEKTNYKQPTFTHIFTPYQIGTLVFSKIII